MAVSKQLAVQRLRLTRQQQQFDTPVAKAEVVVVHGNYGLRIVELSGSSLSDLAL